MSRPKRLDLFCCVCESPMRAERTTKRYCSEACRRRRLYGRDTTRLCRLCETPFEVVNRSDANRRYCSKQCSKKAQQKYVGEWRVENVEQVRAHAAAWRSKNPDYFRSRNAQKRLDTLALLGGGCVVCGVTNPAWLHIDYIPTCRGLKYRHPRGHKYVREHLEDFRLLCANHHYELTLTGHIEGTEITQ